MCALAPPTHDTMTDPIEAGATSPAPARGRPCPKTVVCRMPDIIYALLRRYILSRLDQHPLPRLTALHPRYRNDPKIVARYATKWAENYRFAGEALRLDKEFFKRFVGCRSTSRSILEFADHSIQDDVECVRVALQWDALEFRYASVRLRCNRELVTMAATCVYRMLELACDDLKNDKEIVAAATEARDRRDRCDSHWRT